MHFPPFSQVNLQVSSAARAHTELFSATPFHVTGKTEPVCNLNRITDPYHWGKRKITFQVGESKL